MYNIYNAAGLLGLMVSLSHLQRLCHSIFGRVLEYDTLWTGNLWHFGRIVFLKSLCLLDVPWDWLSSSDFVGVSNRIFRAWNQAILDVCGSLSDSSELPLVTPLAFSDLALALLGGTLLVGGCSDVEVLLIWILHWSLLAAIAFCWLSKLLVTALPCCSLTARMASCIVLWIIAISG